MSEKDASRDAFLDGMGDGRAATRPIRVGQFRCAGSILPYDQAVNEQQSDEEGAWPGIRIEQEFGSVVSDRIDDRFPTANFPLSGTH